MATLITLVLLVALIAYIDNDAVTKPLHVWFGNAIAWTLFWFIFGPAWTLVFSFRERQD